RRTPGAPRRRRWRGRRPERPPRPFSSGRGRAGLRGWAWALPFGRFACGGISLPSSHCGSSGSHGGQIVRIAFSRSSARASASATFEEHPVGEPVIASVCLARMALTCAQRSVNCWSVIVGMAVLLSGCSGGVDEGAAYRSLLAAMDTRAKHMADSSDAAHRARLAVLDSVLVAYGRAFPGFDERNVAGRYHPADSLAAVAHARRAFNLWALGDTAGTNAAYQAGLPWFYALRDSTQRRDRLRRVAFVAGLVDPAAGVQTLTLLEA